MNAWTYVKIIIFHKEKMNKKKSINLSNISRLNIILFILSFQICDGEFCSYFPLNDMRK